MEVCSWRSESYQLLFVYSFWLVCFTFNAITSYLFSTYFGYVSFDLICTKKMTPTDTLGINFMSVILQVKFIVSMKWFNTFLKFSKLRKTVKLIPQVVSTSKLNNVGFLISFAIDPSMQSSFKWVSSIDDIFSVFLLIWYSSSYKVLPKQSRNLSIVEALLKYQKWVVVKLHFVFCDRLHFWFLVEK